MNSVQMTALAVLATAGQTLGQQGVLFQTLEPLEPDEDLHFGMSVDVSDSWIAVGTASTGNSDNFSTLLRHAFGSGVTYWQQIDQAVSNLGGTGFVHDIAVSERGLVIPIVVNQYQCPPVDLTDPFTAWILRYYALDTNSLFAQYTHPSPPTFTGSNCPTNSGPGFFWWGSALFSSIGFNAITVGDAIDDGDDVSLFAMGLELNHATSQLTELAPAIIPSPATAIRDQRDEWFVAGGVSLSSLLDINDTATGSLNGITTSASDISVSSDGRWVVVGFPDEANPNTPSLPAEGVARVYERTPPNSSLLTLRRSISASTVESLTAGSEFGFSVEIENDVLVISAPGQMVPGASMPGAIHTFVLSSDPGLCGTGNECWVYQGGPGTDPLMIQNPPLYYTGPVQLPGTTNGIVPDRFGEEFSLNGNILAVGIPDANIGNEDSVGIVQLYKIPKEADCDNDGVSDINEINNGSELDIDLNGVPDSCQIAGGEPDCNGNGVIDTFEFETFADVVVLFDTSGTMFNEAGALCAATQNIRFRLADLGVASRLTILTINGDPDSIVPCETGAVTSLFCPGDPTDDTICQLLSTNCEIALGDSAQGDLEDWGYGTAVLARNFPWLSNAARVIVPVTDEAARCGGLVADPDTGMSWPDDLQALNSAIFSSVGSAYDPSDREDVNVIPFLGNGTPAWVLTEQLEVIAMATGGEVVDSTLGTESLADAIATAVLPRGIAAKDCNQNGLIDDDCDCLADTNMDGMISGADLNAWILAWNSQLPPGDQNCDGMYTPADFNAWILNSNAYPNDVPCPPQ